MENILKQIYPFAAIVGQEDMKLALILNVINPSLGGVLIRGEKGTAKSTAVRGLVDLLEVENCVDGCRFNCKFDDDMFQCDECKTKKSSGEYVSYKRKKIVVELPVSATEDRVVGTLDIQKAIKLGEKSFEPGILANANNNVLYVDEVNLLDDNVVDVLLDCAAMGVNTVEREGVSFSHPSRFVLIGTMNPEEGDLRPQLLDRFGLVVEIEGEKDEQLRKEIIKNRLVFEDNPQALKASSRVKEEALSKQIEKAKTLLSDITVEEEIFDIVVKIGIALDVDGHRADITLIKAASTLAAFEGEKSVSKRHIEIAAKLALPHRMRKHPFEKSGVDSEKIKDIIYAS